MALQQVFSRTTGSLSKNNLFNIVIEFFMNGKILKEINHTVITLIPKVINPCQTNRYKPISLCLFIKLFLRLWLIS